MEVEQSIITQIMDYISNDHWNYSPNQRETIRTKLHSWHSNYLVDFLKIIKGRFPIPFNDFVEILTRMHNTEQVDTQTKMPFKHIDNEFVCARLNDDDDTHSSLKNAFFSDQGKSLVIASLSAGGHLPLSSFTFRFISFLVHRDLYGGILVFHIGTHTTEGIVLSELPPTETIRLMAKKAAREYKVIGILDSVCIHYDLYYDRSATQGGIFHRDQITGDRVNTRYISLEYFIDPFVVGGTSMPGVLLGPEIVKYVGDPDTYEFNYGENIVKFDTTASLRVLILDGNTVILNNKNIHATPAVVGHMPNGETYRFEDSRRIDLQQQRGELLSGNRSIAMQSIGQTRSFIRGWVTDITHINIENRTQIIYVEPKENESFREIDSTDIVGGGIKLNEFRLTGTPSKIVFKDEPIIRDPDVIKKMISNEMTQIMSLIIFSVIKNRNIKASFTNRKLRPKTSRQQQFTNRKLRSKTSRQQPFTNRKLRPKIVASRQQSFTKRLKKRI